MTAESSRFFIIEEHSTSPLGAGNSIFVSLSFPLVPDGVIPAYTSFIAGMLFFWHQGHVHHLMIRIWCMLSCPKDICFGSLTAELLWCLGAIWAMSVQHFPNIASVSMVLPLAGSASTLMGMSLHWCAWRYADISWGLDWALSQEENYIESLNILTCTPSKKWILNSADGTISSVSTMGRLLP